MAPPPHWPPEGGALPTVLIPGQTLEPPQDRREDGLWAQGQPFPEFWRELEKEVMRSESEWTETERLSGRLARFREVSKGSVVGRRWVMQQE